MAGIKTKGLGKGLEALFGDIEIKTAETTTEYLDKGDQLGEHVEFIDINDIKPNESQPRQYFNEEKINELADSIIEHGIIQPIVVIRAERGFELVAGERRWRAARKAGLKQVPAIVKELTEEQVMLFAIIENVQREDLNPIEEAEALDQMIIKFGLTQEEISKSVGKSRPYITNSLRLLKLPFEIQHMVLEGKLSNGHARALISVEDPEKQIFLANKAVLEGLSVREVERLVKELDLGHQKNAKTKKAKDIGIIEVEKELKELLGTKVTLQHNGKKGKIQIDYYSREELERLIELLKTIN